MANSFAEGFAKSYSSKPMVDAFNKARKERESEKVFQKWKPTPEAQEMFVNMGYKNPAEVEYHDFTERIKLITAADTLQSRKNTLKANAMTLKNKLLTGYYQGTEDRPDEETLGGFSHQIGGTTPEGAFKALQQVPRGLEQTQQNLERQAIGKALKERPKMSYTNIDAIAKKFIKDGNHKAVSVIEGLKAKGLSPDDIMEILISEDIIGKEEAKTIWSELGKFGKNLFN